MSDVLPLHRISFFNFSNGLRSKRGWRFVVSWVLLVLAVESFSAAVTMLISQVPLFAVDANATPFELEVPVFIWAQAGIAFAIGSTLFPLSFHFYSTWKQCQEPTVEEALQRDPRPPILYLRPFEADKLRYPDVNSKASARLANAIGGVPGLLMRYMGSARDPNAEQLMVNILQERGPVIAIGRPKERIPPVGAARIYVGDDWKDVVKKYLDMSQMVLMFAGTTPGFAWELGEIFRSAPFKPTMIVLPFCLKKHKDEEVEAFVQAFTQASGQTVTMDLREVRAIFFRHHREAIYVMKKNEPIERELDSINPFLFPVTQMTGMEDLAWSENYVASARTKAVQTRNRIGIFVGGIVGFKLLLMLGRFVWGIAGS